MHDYVRIHFLQNELFQKKLVDDVLLLSIINSLGRMWNLISYAT